LLLPKDTAEILPYFEALAAEMPENPRLLAHVEALSNSSIQSGTDGQADTPRVERAPQSFE
jgi:hypothetical protein